MVARLDDVEKKYYVRVEELSKNSEEFDSNVCENVFDQIKSDGITRVFCDKGGSRVIERLLQDDVLDESCIKTLLDAVISNLSAVASDRCGSHSLEALIKAIGKSKSLSTEDSDDAILPSFLQVCEDIVSCIGHFLTQPYASHVVCAAVQVLSGVHIPDCLTRSRYSQEFRKAKMEDEKQGKIVKEPKMTVPEVFINLLNKLAKRVCKLDDFQRLLMDPCASPVLQVLLRACVKHLPRRGNKMVTAILKYVDVLSCVQDGDTLPQVFTSIVGSHLMGVVIELASADCHQLIWESCFRSRVLSFALHPVANYPLQQFMTVTVHSQV